MNKNNKTNSYSVTISATTNWTYVSLNCDLSQEFITANKDKVDWWGISSRQNLSEAFIAANKDKVDWPCISRFQKLSEAFRSVYYCQ